MWGFAGKSANFDCGIRGHLKAECGVQSADFLRQRSAGDERARTRAASGRTRPKADVAADVQLSPDQHDTISEGVLVSR